MRTSAVLADFLLDPDIVFLNHGSFGACPRPVFERYQAWQRELESQPVEFLARRLPDLLADARVHLGSFVGADADDLTFVPNATSAVYMAARAIALQAGDEVRATTLEYGGCDLLWEKICNDAGARYVRAPVELPLESGDQILEALFAAVSSRTRAIFISHITSETALVLPLAEIVQRARELGLTTIVDGAHGPGHVDIDLEALGADFYAGNCHKWLCAPKGAGFLYTRREWQDAVDGLIVTWGYEQPATFRTRTERQGTRDPSAYLTVPAAIEWTTAHGDHERCRALACDAQTRLSELDGVSPVAAPDLLAQMVAVSIATDGADELQRRLYDEHRIEVPVRARKTESLLRASFAPYNDESDLDALVGALAGLLRTDS